MNEVKSEPKLTYETDHDSGLIELFVDGALLTTWTYEDEAELAFIEFKKIFDAGFNYLKS